MSLTRRELLKLATALPAVSPLAMAAKAPSFSQPKGAEPNLFFGAGEVAAMSERYTHDPRFERLRERIGYIDREAERRFLREEVVFNDVLHHFRRVHDLGQDMAFGYLLTGDEDALALALEAGRTLMKFPRWDFFMEDGTDRQMGNQRAPSGAIAIACMIDWLGDQLEAAEREEWLDALVERACVPIANTLEAYLDPHNALPWKVNPDMVVAQSRSKFPVDGHRRIEITAETNLRGAPAGAMAIAVALLRRHRPGLAELGSWHALAVDNFRDFDVLYHPDGSYGEGVSYGNYTSESLFMGMEALRRAGLEDVTQLINWPGHVEFMLEMAMPIERNPYEIINISDNGRPRYEPAFRHPAGRSESRSAMPFWVARHYRDGRAQWFGENLAAHHNLWSLVFFDPSVKPVAPENKPKLWVADVEWPVMRTGYRSQDLVACLRSGDGYNHEHADRNTIIVKAFGDELVVDPMRPPYPFYDPSWMMRTTAGHSGVLINGTGHFYHNGSEGTNRTFAQARLVDRADTREYAFVTSDATQAYRLVDVEIKQVVRSMIVFYDAAVVVILDRLGMYHHPADFEARFMTENWDGELQLSAGDGRFTIERPFARAHGQVHGRTPITVSTGKLPIPEERAEKNPFVAVRTEGAQTTTLVTTLALSPRGGRPATVDVTTTPESFVLNVAGRYRCEIGDAGRYPEINIS